MPPALPEFVLILNGAIAAVVAVLILYAIACHIARERAIHDLTVETHRLRREYLERLERLRRGERAEAGHADASGEEPVMEAEPVGYAAPPASSDRKAA